MLILSIDAAWQPTTGASSAGLILQRATAYHQYKTNLPSCPNNQTAELNALLWACQLVQTHHPELLTAPVKIISDSKLVVDSLTKRYAKHYQSYIDMILDLCAQWPLVFFQWVPEKKLQGPHRLAQQALE